MKYIRKLFFPLIILAVLTLALVVYLVVNKVRTDAINKQYAQKSIQVCAASDIQTLVFSEPSGETAKFDFGSNGSITSATHDDNTFDATQINEEALSQLVDAICTIYYDKDLDLASVSASEYGLDSDRKTITITKKSGNSIVLHCGNALPNKSGIYVRMNDEQKIYIASSTFYEASNLIFQDMLSEHVLGFTKKDVLEVTYTRKSTDEKMIIRPDEDYDNGVYLESRYTVKYPIERDPSDDLILLMDRILDLQATSYVAIAEDELDAYGLADPEYKFDLTMMSGDKVEISFSRELNGYYYGHCSTNPYYFRVLEENLRGLNTPVLTLIDSYVRFEYLNDVKSIQGKVGDISFKMEIFLDSTYSLTSESTTLTLDQRNAKVYSHDGSCYGLVLFGSVCNMRISGMDKEASPKLENIAAEFSIVRTDASSYTVKLVERDKESYYCFIDDRYSGFIVDRSVLYKDNGHEMTGFGVVDAYNLVNEAIDNQDASGFYERP